MINEKKNFFLSWVFIVAFVMGGIIKDVVSGIIGFKYNMFSNEFNILYFSADTLMYMVCFGIVYFGMTLIKNKCVRKK